MSLALIHDRDHIKTFWQKRIDAHCRHDDMEQQRMGSSALGRLREEWLRRLESRTKHLSALGDGYVRRGTAEPPADRDGGGSEREAGGSGSD